jgi:GNAT superfamily N-acetyltransferase
MITLTPLLDNTADSDVLSAGLARHLQASGMPLPEDRNMLEYLRMAARHGTMQVVVAVQDGPRRVTCGIVAWRVDQRAGFVNLLYVLPQLPADIGMRVACELLEHALAGAQREGVPLGVFAELAEVPEPVRQALGVLDFVGVERVIMHAELAGQAWDAITPPGYTLRGWQAHDLRAAADVIYRANVGTLDAQIIPELRALEGVHHIVRQTVGGRYGAFDAEASGVILDSEGEAAGVTLATRRRSGQGFTAEICVLPEHRRHGLARALLARTHACLMTGGVTTAMLGVTGGNPARRLYESMGYTPIGSVWTYVWPRPDDWLGWPSA